MPALPSQQRLSHHAAGNQRTADAERCATQRECMPMPNAAFTMSDAEMRHRLSKLCGHTVNTLETSVCYPPTHV